MTTRQYFPSRPKLDRVSHTTYEVILRDFITNALNHFLLADTEITVAKLYGYISALWCAWYSKSVEEHAPFNEISELAVDRIVKFKDEYQERIHSAYDGKLNTDENVAAYYEDIRKNVPECEPHDRVNQFIGEYYFNLDRSIRNVTDPALYGFLFLIINDPDFATLCRDKTLNVSAMALEEKMTVPLDHNALYRYLIIEKLRGGVML